MLQFGKQLNLELSLKLYKASVSFNVKITNMAY